MNASITIIRPTETFDSVYGNQFRQEVRDALNGATKGILVDCKAVTFMDSSGLGSLVMAMKEIRATAQRFALCSLNAQIIMLLDITSMSNVFEIYASPEDFEQALLATEQA